MKQDFLVTIIIPVFNEEKNIEPLLERLTPILKPYKHEILFVSDGSRDNTVEEIKKHTAKNKLVKLVAFYRNFGHQNALSAGYQYAKGDCIISIDADLQDPPEIIPQMIEKWQNGAKIVYAKRAKRETDTFFKKNTATFFYKFMNFLSDVPVPQNVGDFRLIDKEVMDYLNTLPEHSKFLRGLVAWGGYPADYVYFDREKRHAGKTHYPLSKMINFAMEGITSCSAKPLRIATYLGFISASISLLGILYALVGRCFRPAFFPQDWVSGWTLLFIGIMFMGGVQLITIGIIGEYVGKIFKEVQNRPQYVIKETVNV